MSSLALPFKTTDLNQLSRDVVSNNNKSNDSIADERSPTTYHDDEEEADKYLNIWKNLWSKRDTAWHLDSFHPVLLRYQDKLLEGRSTDNPARVLLPLCGKSNDLKFFYQQGHHILGVECADEAIYDFFNLNGLNKEISKVPATKSGKIAKLYSTPDRKLNIMQNNFLTLDSKLVNGTIDCVWDRGAFGTITEEEQNLYIQTIRRLLAPNFKYLLLVLEFDQSKSCDPVPMPQPEQKVRSYFGSFCHIEKLESRVPNHVGLYQRHMGNPMDIRETVYFMTPKK